MDFELIASSLDKAASHQADALLVLVPDAAAQTSPPPLPEWLSQPLTRGDLDTKAGSSLPVYSLPPLAAPRACLAGVGEAALKKHLRAIFAATQASDWDDLRRRLQENQDESGDDARPASATSY